VDSSNSSSDLPCCFLCIKGRKKISKKVQIDYNVFVYIFAKPIPSEEMGQASVDP
jgi:hypothetical protein